MQTLVAVVHNELVSIGTDGNSSRCPNLPISIVCLKSLLSVGREYLDLVTVIKCYVNVAGIIHCYIVRVTAARNGVGKGIVMGVEDLDSLVALVSNKDVTHVIGTDA